MPKISSRSVSTLRRIALDHAPAPFYNIHTDYNGHWTAACTCGAQNPERFRTLAAAMESHELHRAKEVRLSISDLRRLLKSGSHR